MQRLRSPFRLRPGPGADQRKAKARKEEQQLPEGNVDVDTDGRRAAGADDASARGADDASARDDSAGAPQIRQKITGASLRTRRAQEPGRPDGGDHSSDPSSGSQ